MATKGFTQIILGSKNISNYMADLTFDTEQICSGQDMEDIPISPYILS